MYPKMQFLKKLKSKVERMKKLNKQQGVLVVILPRNG
jgi:hypothetical protein